MANDENKSNKCINCGLPWFGEKRCTCYLSRFRERYPEYYNYNLPSRLRFTRASNTNPYTYNKNNVHSNTPDKLGNEETSNIKPRVPLIYLPGCDCAYCKAYESLYPDANGVKPVTNDENKTDNTRTDSSNSIHSEHQPKSDSHVSKSKSDSHESQSNKTNPYADTPLITINLRTDYNARQWKEIYPPSFEASKSEEDQTDQDPEKQAKLQLIKLNQIEEENRRKKNRMLIDSILDYDPTKYKVNDPSFSGLDSLNNLSKYLDQLKGSGDSIKKHRGPNLSLPLLTDTEMMVDTCYLDDLELEQKYKCPNPNCDHDESGPEITVPQFESVDSIEKIIEIAQTFNCKRNKTFCGIDMEKMYGLIEPLQDLQDMIGLSENKEKIVEQIVFFLKGYQDIKNRDMMHTVITGPPGTGKTTFARIIGKIYSKLGLVSKGHFVEVSREDLVGKYLGHTAPKTNETIDKCLGGIMFIDEVYALGHSEKRDSFSKECIDVLNQRLSENRDMLCIIAGYKDDIEKCFFDQNKGLKRRFPFVYDISGYNCEELMKIYHQKITRDNWKIADGTLEKFKDRFDSKLFKFYAGDVETFVFKTKICFAQTHFYSESRTIDEQTLECGFTQFTEDRNGKETEEQKKKREYEEYIRNQMYI